MEKIIVPNINNNETEAILVEWTKEDGAFVKKEDLIATLETTKTTFDLVASNDGNLKIIGEESKKYAFGELIGWIYNGEDELKKIEEGAIDQHKAETDSINITEPARKFMKQHGISEDKVRQLGLKIIKKVDIEHLAEDEKSSITSIDPRQVVIGKTVMTSRNTIPDAFLVKRVDVTKALTRASAYSAENKILAGLPELFIFSIASLLNKSPYFFGTIIDTYHFKNSESANIGVTFDVGKGLFIPVITGANALTIKEIAVKMMVYRMKALRNNFISEELENGNITLSLNMDADTLFVQPIIFPGQTCMISIGAIIKELSLDNKNKVVEKQYVQIGLAYDHRVINGFEANSFLTSVKLSIETSDLDS